MTSNGLLSSGKIFNGLEIVSSEHMSCLRQCYAVVRNRRMYVRPGWAMLARVANSDQLIWMLRHTTIYVLEGRQLEEVMQLQGRYADYHALFREDGVYPKPFEFVTVARSALEFLEDAVRLIRKLEQPFIAVKQERRPMADEPDIQVD